MIRNLLLLMILLTGFLPAQIKSTFDINDISLKKANGTSSGAESTNNKLEATLLPGAYFTVGTNKGVSVNNLDNKCQITYGHPYAQTSHGLISIDGEWHRISDVFSTSEMFVSGNNDTLKLYCSNDLMEYELLIVNHMSGTITIIQKVVNSDVIPHRLSTGIVIDPALGKWGDGSLYADNRIIENDTIITSTASSPNFTIWEKRSGARGIGLSISSDANYKLLAGNWNSEHSFVSPEKNNGEKSKLYDLLLRIYVNASQLSSGAEAISTFELGLMEPDFSSDVFTRWDLQDYIDMSDGLMFPRQFDTYAEINKLTAVNLTCTVEPVISSHLISPVQQYTTNVNSGTVFQKIPLGTGISYENKVVEAVLKIRVNNVLTDEIRRYVFIPETPVSDTGLTINIDTVKAGSFPKVEFTFNVINNETQIPVTGLTKENIFLYENSSRIYDFIIGHDTSQGVNAADIVFALDVTGSMGNVIDKVKTNIVEFADSLKKRGIDYRLGLVTFLDEIENVYDFTKDVNTFKNWISQQYAHGGGDGPENSLAALKRSAEFNYRTNCKRIVIWITDIDYHEKDWATPLTKKEVTDLLLLNDITVNAIGNTGYKASSYDPILLPTNGKFYDINGNFRDILLDISRMKASGKLVILYNSPSVSSSNSVKIEVKYAGLGGSTEFIYSKSEVNSGSGFLSFYPNPFNPEITFIINNSDYVKGNISIFNILGECVKSYSIGTGAANSRLTWNARNDGGIPVSTGFYIVQLVLTNSRNEIFTESAKILYMK